MTAVPLAVAVAASLAASLIAATAASADPLPIDNRCGGEMALAAGAPTDGWTVSPRRLPGKAGKRESCFEAGMDDYVTEPIRVERLVDALRAVTPHDHA